MTKILSLNIGSSSVKYSVFENQIEIHKGLIERVGKRLTYEKAVRMMIQHLEKERIKKSEIEAIGHRFVYGGELRNPCKVTNAILKKLYMVKDLAPLHNIPELKGIEACKKQFSCPNYVVFDTSFHSTIPEAAAIYPIPKRLTKKYKIRRYGFHGISHQYVSEQASKILKKKNPNLITCHLGNGSSITAIKNGKSVDTSMGFTPLEGLMMGTRSGDLDPAIPFFLSKKEKNILEILNHKSGFEGVCGKHDVRDIVNSKNKDCRLAVEMYCYRAAKYIGAYANILGKVDAIVFTAGIGENSAEIRKNILKKCSGLNIHIDPAKNKKNSQKISKSGIKILVIPTDEAKEIAIIIKKLMKA